jgi:polyisoprenyl-phosphate glycosyltransferase
MKTISIITPIYNESENIIDCCESVKNFFLNKEYNYEHILVDNSSNDDGLSKIKELLKKDKKIKLIVNAKNYGIMPSLFNALKFTSGDAVLTCYACDMQDPIEFLDAFIKKWEEGFEVVYAIRKKRHENYLLSFIKLTYYKIYNSLSYGIKKDNFVNVFQLIDKNIVEKLRRFETSYPHVASMINSVTGNSVGVETTWVKRSKGQAKNNFFALLQEAVITLTQFTIFLPVIALGTLIFTTLSSVLLFIIKIFTNIGHDLFITLAISLIMFNFLLLFITILVLSIKIYYLSKDIKKDNVVLVKETYNL